MTELAAEKLPELSSEFRSHFEPASEFEFSLAFYEKQISRFTRDDDELWVFRKLESRIPCELRESPRKLLRRGRVAHLIEGH
jgi:hypothetical protein